MTDYDDLAEETVPGHPHGIAPRNNEFGADPADHVRAGELADPEVAAPFLGRKVNVPDVMQNGNGILANVEFDGDEVRVTFTDGRALTVQPDEDLIFENE